MNTSNLTLRRLLGNGFRFEIPKYQRDYSWSDEQWNDLWFDISQVIKTNDEHYMGYLVFQSDDEKNFKVIDGQQRLITVSILILAIVKNLTLLPGNENEKETNLKRAETIRSTYIGNIDMLTLVSENKLILNRNNDRFYKTYLSALQELPQRGLNASEKLMKKAFETFDTFIKSEYKSAESLINLLDKITDCLLFTVITVSDELNAFKVFETLNARGVQLSSSDLLKNYIFSVADSNQLHSTRINELEDLWSEITETLGNVQVSDFLRIYWNSTHKTVRKNQLYKTIRDEITTPEQVYSLLRDLRKKANVFVALKNPQDELWITKSNIKTNLELLKLFSITQPFPLLLTTYCELPEQFESLLSKIIVISFRYNIICSKNPNEQEVVYNKLALKILDSKQIDYDYLKSSIYIDDNEFEESFTYKEFVKGSQNDQIAKYILNKIEIMNCGTNFQSEEGAVTLEHILPDSPNENDWNFTENEISQYHYRLGNLTLLELVINKKIGNVGFKTKKEEYKKSNIPMTKEIGLSSIDEWTILEIEKRQKKLAKMAKGIWQI